MFCYGVLVGVGKVLVLFFMTGDGVFQFAVRSMAQLVCGRFHAMLARQKVGLLGVRDAMQVARCVQV